VYLEDKRLVQYLPQYVTSRIAESFDLEITNRERIDTAGYVRPEVVRQLELRLPPFFKCRLDIIHPIGEVSQTCLNPFECLGRRPQGRIDHPQLSPRRIYF